eukprot:gene29280-12523_t
MILGSQDAAGLRSGLETSEFGTDSALPPHDFNSLQDHVQRRIACILRMHVLGSVRGRVEAGHLDFINEIRRLTCMFLGFPSLTKETHDATHQEQVDAVQFAVVQGAALHWLGDLLCTCVGARKIRSEYTVFNDAINVSAPSTSLRYQPHFNTPTTSGDLLCTCVGARKIRSEYTVFGDAINLSARLMVKCKNGGMADILCDEPTHAFAKYKATYEELERMQLKGKEHAVLVYRVSPYEDFPGSSKATRSIELAAGENPVQERPLVGRDLEMTQVLSKAAAMIAGRELGEAIILEGNTNISMANTNITPPPSKSSCLAPTHPPTTQVLSKAAAMIAGREPGGAFVLSKAAAMIAGREPGGAIVLEGNTGMGKTKLLVEVGKSLEGIRADTVKNGKPAFHMLSGMADIASKSQKLHPWRRIFQDLFLIDLSKGALTARPVPRKRLLGDDDTQAAATMLGDKLSSSVAKYNEKWRRHVSEILDIPLSSIPMGLKELAADAVHFDDEGSVHGGRDRPSSPTGGPAFPVSPTALNVNNQVSATIAERPPRNSNNGARPIFDT